MSLESEHRGRGTAPARNIMPPHLVLRDFLTGPTLAGLLDYALARQAEFAPTKVGRLEEGLINASVRVSVGTRDLGPFKPILKSKVLGMLPELIAKLHVAPPDSPKLEMELVAHNDGAFYKRHIDTHTAGDRTHIRVLSGVYYFHAEPKAFSGGALRLYAIGGVEAGHVDVEPVRNSLLIFPAWAPHEVMPISCPSGSFADSRFAINCWVHYKKRTQA